MAYSCRNEKINFNKPILQMIERLKNTKLTNYNIQKIHAINFTILYNKLDMQSKFQHFQSFYWLSSEPIPLLLPFQP